MRIRAARSDAAEAIAATEAGIQRTPGFLVAWPGEIPLTAYRDKIAKLAGHGRYIVAEEDLGMAWFPVR